MPKRILQGPVVSDKGDKTVVVRVDRSYLHPLLKKVVRRSKRYHAHDEANSAKAGDVVQIIECAPKSKLKRWEVVTPEIAADLETQAKAAAEVEEKRKADAEAAS